MDASILVIDDEPQLRKMLRLTLENAGYSVVEAATGNEGIDAAAAKGPDLILLDLGLPDRNGHDVLRHLRDWYASPVIILSVQDNSDDIVKALDNGANDYLTKPFRPEELLARIRSAIRHFRKERNVPVSDFGDLTVDFVNRAVRKRGALVKLTPIEYQLLCVLIQNESKVLTHQYLLGKVWGPDNQNDLQYLRVFVANLRKKIEDDPNRPSHILTESGLGYRFLGNTTQVK
jgi:two-component system KDP operon response regulator KdpE